MYPFRQQQLEAVIESSGLNAAVFNAEPSLAYLTGLHFYLAERPVLLLVSPGKKPVIILPELEKKKLDSVEFPLHSFTYHEAPSKWSGVFLNAVRSLCHQDAKIGAEPRQLRLLEYNLIAENFAKVNIIDASDIIAELRSIKDPNEIDLMKEAVHIVQYALKATLPLAKTGITEKELANELVMQLLRHGSDPSLPYSPIVSSGPSGANPHARPSQRQLTPGDLLSIDQGAAWKRYPSDLTRTFTITGNST